MKDVSGVWAFNSSPCLTSNHPSQVYPGGGIATGPHVYGVFAGRTACREIMAELNMGESAECIKRCFWCMGV